MTFQEQHMGKPIVLPLDGEVILAPRVNGTISDKAQLNGNFSTKELRRLFEALVLH